MNRKQTSPKKGCNSNVNFIKKSFWFKFIPLLKRIASINITLEKVEEQRNLNSWAELSSKIKAGQYKWHLDVNV